MGNLIEELSQELKEERIRNAVVRYFPYILVAIGGMMIIISVMMWRNSVIKMKNELATDMYLDFFVTQNPDNKGNLVEKVNETGSNLAEFLTILVGYDKNIEIKSKLLKDLESLTKLSNISKDNIFYLSLKEKEIIECLQKNDKKKAKTLLDDLISSGNIPASINNRLEAVKVLIEENE